MATLTTNVYASLIFDYYSNPGYKTYYVTFDYAEDSLRGVTSPPSFTGKMDIYDPTHNSFETPQQFVDYHTADAITYLNDSLNTYASGYGVDTYVEGVLIYTNNLLNSLFAGKQPQHVNLDKFSATSLSNGCLFRASSDSTAINSLSMTDFVADLMSCSDTSSLTSGMGLATVAMSGSYTDLTSKPTIPTTVSQLTNDSGFTTSSAVSTSYVPKTTTVNGHALSGNVTVTTSDLGLSNVATSGAYSDLSGKPTIPTAVSQLTNDSSFITSTSAASTYVAKTVTVNGHALSGNVTVSASDLSLATVASTGAYSDLTGKPSLATVATSGSYTDLSNKPTIPAAQVQTDWNASTGLGVLLNKPTIPSTTATPSQITTYTFAGTGATGAQVSSTKNATLGLTFSTSVTITLGGSPVSRVTVKTCSTNSSTESDWLEVGRTSTSQPTTLTVTVGGVYTQEGQVYFDLPAGYYWKAQNSGSGTHSEAFVIGRQTIFG